MSGYLKIKCSALAFFPLSHQQDHTNALLTVKNSPTDSQTIDEHVSWLQVKQT